MYTFPDVFTVNTTQTLAQESGDINQESISNYIIRFNSCQREFCFEVNLKEDIERPESGEQFVISVSRTPGHVRSILLIPDKTIGYIEIR